MVLLKVGDEFESYVSFELRLRAHEELEKCKYFIRDSKTIQAARKKQISRPLNAAIKYYLLKVSCIHGGKKFKKRGSGIRNSRYVIW
jgi:hypothetical protein